MSERKAKGKRRKKSNDARERARKRRTEGERRANPREEDRDDRTMGVEFLAGAIRYSHFSLGVDGDRCARGTWLRDTELVRSSGIRYR